MSDQDISADVNANNLEPSFEATARISEADPDLREADSAIREFYARTADVSRPADAKTLAELMEGRLGRVHSGGDQRLSESCGEKLADDLVKKRREGHL